MNDWKYLENYATKIEHLLTMEQPILSGDAQAIELLEEKLENLKEHQERMKAVNKAVKLKDTAKGDEQLKDMGYSDDQIKNFRNRISAEESAIRHTHSRTTTPISRGLRAA